MTAYRVLDTTIEIDRVDHPPGSLIELDDGTAARLLGRGRIERLPEADGGAGLLDAFRKLDPESPEHWTRDEPPRPSLDALADAGVVTVTAEQRDAAWASPACRALRIGQAVVHLLVADDPELLTAEGAPKVSAVAERSGVADVTAEQRDAAVKAIEARNAA